MKTMSSQSQGKPRMLLKSAFLYSVCTCITSAEQADQEVAVKEATHPINLPNKEEDSSISIQAPTTLSAPTWAIALATSVASTPIHDEKCTSDLELTEDSEVVFVPMIGYD